MFTEQRIRGVLFYLSVAIFFLGLPFILSFALGYRFDAHTFKFTKSGLIVLKTQPQGAAIYLNKKLLDEKTPVTINELLPGTYRLSVELDKHYPWVSDVSVEAGKVTRVDKIILFPLRPDIEQLNKERLSSFLLDEEKDALYYVSPEDKRIYKSDLKGEHFENVASFPELGGEPALKWKISPDREKLLCFSAHKIAAAYLHSSKELTAQAPIVLDYPNSKIIDIFWHSDSYHIILISERNIEVLEVRPQSAPVNLAALNKKNTSAHYDIRADALYFLDSQIAADGKFYDNLYKLELNAKTFPFGELIKLKSNE